jgi:hypothetical protein
MSSKNTLRGRKARAASRPSLALECLESRLALAVLGGNVNAQLVGSTLLLTGDALDNALVVSTATGGRMAVLGGLGTTINGSTSPFVTSRPVTSIVANLNAGNDIIGFTNSAVGLVNQLTPLGIFSPFAPTLQADIDAATGGIPTFTLPGSVTVTTAAGNDAVGLIGTVGGSVAANLGSSSSVAGPGQGNGFTIGNPSDSSVANRIGGSLSVVGGNQRDAVKVYGTDVGGGVSAALGNGENFAFLFGFGSTFGSLAYTGGTGQDGVSLQLGLSVRNGVSIFTGPQGEDIVSVVQTVNIGGSLVVNTGVGNDRDELLLTGSVRRDVSVATGGGNDFIQMSSTVGGGLAVSSGAGSDLVQVLPSSVGLNAVIDAGAGDDQVGVSSLSVRYNLTVSLGGGTDGLTLINVSAFAAFLYGGTGTNTLNIDAPSRTGIRTLRYYQFQTVNNI